MKPIRATKITNRNKTILYSFNAWKGGPVIHSLLSKEKLNLVQLQKNIDKVSSNCAVMVITTV